MPMPNIPGDSMLDTLGGFFIALGIFLVLGGLGLARLEKFTTSQGKKTWGTGAILIILGAAFLLNNTNTAGKSPRQDESFPLQVVSSYDFEDRSDTTFVDPWEPQVAANDLSISSAKEYARSGTNSLRVSTDLPPYAGTDESLARVTASITLDNVKAVAAWILLPQSEHSRNRQCSAHIAANVLMPNDETSLVTTSSITLEPGEWIPLFLGAFEFSLFHEFSDTRIKLNNSSNQIMITVWCGRAYAGSIYLDDITIYGDSK